MNAEEDVTVRDLETGLRRRLQEKGRLALGEVLSQADVDPARNMACDCGGVLQYQRRRCAKVLRVFGWVYLLRISNYVPISSASCTNSDYRAK